MNAKNKISVFSFAKEVKQYFFNPTNEKYVKWIEQPLYLQVYESVPEHTATIDFILNNLVLDGIDDIDFWTLQKYALDYLIYGGFVSEVQKLRGGGFKINYLDQGHIRFNGDKNKLGYSEDFNNRKIDIVWKPIAKNITEDGIFMYKNNKSRGLYPTPYYYSALKSLDTMSLISTYHNNNAKNGFTPNVIINFNSGEPTEDEKAIIEQQILDKFTGPTASKFIMSFNDNKDSEVTIKKLDNDNLDQKFESLQKFIQNQIMISHKLTSPQLIGVKAENQGFSKTEYEESFEIFYNVVISALRRELEYGLSLLLNKEIKLKVLEEDKEDTQLTTENKPDMTEGSDNAVEDKNNNVQNG